MKRVNQPIKSEDVDLWKVLAMKLAKRVCPFIRFKGSDNLPVEETYLAGIFEEEIKKFAEDRIVRVYQKVKIDENEKAYCEVCGKELNPDDPEYHRPTRDDDQKRYFERTCKECYDR